MEVSATVNLFVNRMIDNLKIVLKQFADFDEDELNKITDCFKNKTVQKKHRFAERGNCLQ